MSSKKQHIVPLKKDNDKKKEAVSNSKTKSDSAKQTIRKKLNEFGDNDSL
jgi:hypothetical protein